MIALVVHDVSERWTRVTINTRTKKGYKQMYPSSLRLIWSPLSPIIPLLTLWTNERQQSLSSIVSNVSYLFPSFTDSWSVTKIRMRDGMMEGLRGMDPGMESSKGCGKGEADVQEEWKKEDITDTKLRAHYIQPNWLHSHTQNTRHRTTGRQKSARGSKANNSILLDKLLKMCISDLLVKQFFWSHHDTI